MKGKGFLRFVIEALAIALAVGAVVGICDSRRVFASDEQNNHVGKKWHFLYQYARQKTPVDILVVGNSHTYTGLLPERIQEYAGKRCFLLAAPGVYADDCCCMLEEALTLVKPRWVVIETYPINSYRQKKLTGQDLSDQFASFASRRNTGLKLRSTFRLFTLENAPFAWSGTLRNHDIIFDNPELLSYNLKHPRPPRYDPREDYRGRFIRFTSGLTQKTLDRYAKEGPPVDGSAVRPGPDAVRAVERMKEMCRKKGIKVTFLTLPMYHDHVAGAEAWHANLMPVTGDTPWLDLQLPEYDQLFGPDCFEDTYGKNQHLTAEGAAACSWCLSQWLGWLETNSK